MNIVIMLALLRIRFDHDTYSSVAFDPEFPIWPPSTQRRAIRLQYVATRQAPSRAIFADLAVRRGDLCPVTGSSRRDGSSSLSHDYRPRRSVHTLHVPRRDEGGHMDGRGTVHRPAGRDARRGETAGERSGHIARLRLFLADRDTVAGLCIGGRQSRAPKWPFEGSTSVLFQRAVPALE